MHENDLVLANWLQLSEASRRANFGQVLRYFVSPLIPINWIQPEKISWGNSVFKTYSAWINGEKFSLIPAQPQLMLGWNQAADKLAASEWFVQAAHGQVDADAQVFVDKADVDRYITEFTSEARLVDMPPLLVAQTAQPLGWLAQGLYSDLTRQFAGNQLFYQRYQSEIQNLLYRQRQTEPTDQNSLIEGQHVVLRLLVDYQSYQVLEKVNLTPTTLRQTLHQQGFDLLSVDQYEWLKGGGQGTLFLSGNHLKPIATQQLPNRFGLQFKRPQASYEVTTDPLVYKGGQCLTGGRYLLEQLLPASPFYESGVATAALGNESLALTYRKVIPIVLD